MVWIVAMIIAGLIIGGLVGGTVVHPILYGLFIAAIVIIPLWLACSILSGIINGLFCRR